VHFPRHLSRGSPDLDALIHVTSGIVLIPVVYRSYRDRRQPDCSLADGAMTQRLIGIYPEVAMVPGAVLAVFDDNFERQRRDPSRRPLR